MEEESTRREKILLRARRGWAQLPTERKKIKDGF